MVNCVIHLVQASQTGTHCLSPDAPVTLMSLKPKESLLDSASLSEHIKEKRLDPTLTEKGGWNATGHHHCYEIINRAATLIGRESTPLPLRSCHAATML